MEDLTSVLRLIAVDERKTYCGEDGFLFEEEGAVKRLVVASVIPPEDISINTRNFCFNLFQSRKEKGPPEHFLTRKDRVSLGLKSYEPSHILMTIFEFTENGEFTVTVATGFAVAEITTYDAFSSNSDFGSFQKTIEEFLFQEPHIFSKYTSSQSAEFWRGRGGSARRLISSMLAMYNLTVARYALKMKIETIKRSGDNLRFKTQGEAVFKAPLRRADSFVNILNLLASIEERSLPYPLKKIQGLVGRGFPIKTT
jgi:hypothetical protein